MSTHSVFHCLHVSLNTLLTEYRCYGSVIHNFHYSIVCRCRCGKCPAQDSEVDSLCCLEVNAARECIDRHKVNAAQDKDKDQDQDSGEPRCLSATSGFATVCLDAEVLLVAYTHYNRLPGPQQRERRSRYTAYRQLARWLHGRMGRHHRTPLPACCVEMIHKAFPSPDGTYVHYQVSERL